MENGSRIIETRRFSIGLGKRLTILSSSFHRCFNLRWVKQAWIYTFGIFFFFFFFPRTRTRWKSDVSISTKFDAIRWLQFPRYPLIFEEIKCKTDIQCFSFYFAHNFPRDINCKLKRANIETKMEYINKKIRSEFIFEKLLQRRIIIFSRDGRNICYIYYTL